MRFLVREQAYERPLMAGRYAYQRDGVPTGAVESWRLTAVDMPDQSHQILRVDLDGRASSGHTYLYHALLDADGLVSRLQYRFWTMNRAWRIQGDVQRDGHTAVWTHTLNKKSTSQALTLAAGFPLWFPSVIGLHLAVEGQGVTLHGRVPHQTSLTPHLAQVQIRQIADQREILWRDMADEPQKRTIWPDGQTGWPTKMAREGGELTAVATSWQVYSR